MNKRTSAQPFEHQPNVPKCPKWKMGSVKLQHVDNHVSKLAQHMDCDCALVDGRRCESPRDPQHGSGIQLIDQTLVIDPHYQRCEAASLPIRSSSYHDVRFEDLGSAILMEKLDCMEKKLFRRLLGYFCHNEELYSEVDMVYRV
ncbi:hypothetical protein RB195_003119 [Necator americanus]|uniref:Uncharacterized protein n=1 Tax=Necator americanus TaxID=51031 RepID=A0ABR1DM72_NECAM